MSLLYTTDELIDDILLFGHIPIGNNTFTAANLLRIATLELQTPLMKQILSSRGGYYMTYLDYEVEDGVEGLYPIPSDCVAGALMNIELIQGPTIVPVNQIEESEQFSTNSPTSTSYGFFPRGNYIQILPTPPVGHPRFWYLKRTSELVTTAEASQVTVIASNVITVSSIPSSLSIGISIDALGDQPPFNILGTRSITDVTGSNITLDSAVTDLSVGDWLAPEGQTPVPQIPVEYRIQLVQRVIVKVYELQGYLDKMKAAEEKLKEYELATLGLISPRVKSQTKIINPVIGGFLSANSNRLTNFPAGRLS